MIVKEYYQNINVHKPRDYFERWYADVWQRRISKRHAGAGELGHVLEEELAKVGATAVGKDNDYKFVVTFRDEQEYLMFVLKWA